MENSMKQTPWLGFTIDRNITTPIFEQICAVIRHKATTGELAKGSKLPPTRAFATELGVSRSTIVTAYDQLVAEGYLRSAPGSGYTVSSLGVVEIEPTAPTADRQNRSAATLSPSMRQRPFAAGEPDMRLFPNAGWAKTLSRVCRTNSEAMLISRSPLGNPDLREAIAQHLSEWRGIEASPDQIIVTAGSIDALEICIRRLTRPGDSVGLENPGYRPLRAFVTASGLSPRYLSIDGHGARAPKAGENLKLIFLTPSHQFPLGGAMSPERRLEFVQWSARHDRWIVEDDYDSEFRYSGRPIPALTGFDRQQRTIYVGSFSKIFSDSLRLGYLVVPIPLQHRFVEPLNQDRSKASYLPQQALADFIKSGAFYRHIRKVRRIYSERRKYLFERLAQEFSDFGTFTDHKAGMLVAFHINKPLIDTDIVAAAKSRNLILEALSDYCAEAEHYNGLLLGFSGFNEQEIDDALTELKKVLTAGFSG